MCLLYQAFGDLQEEKLAMDGGLRLSNIVRNYIHAERGDMPAERQVTWRGCARDWITEGEFNNHNHNHNHNHWIGSQRVRSSNLPMSGSLICWQKIIKLGLLRHGKK